MGTKQGNVIKILSEQALIINCGLKDGIQLHDTVHVLFEGEEITDKDTSLGKLEYVKAALRVAHIQENMATCVPITLNAPSGEPALYRTVSSDMARIAMDRSPYGVENGRMDVKPGDVSGMPSISPVGVGDEVVVFSDM